MFDISKIRTVDDFPKNGHETIEIHQDAIKPPFFRILLLH